MQKEKFFIIAAGGYLPKPIVEEFVVDEADMDAEFDDFEEFKNYNIWEGVAEYEQKFAKTIVLTEAQAKEIGVYLTKED